MPTIKNSEDKAVRTSVTLSASTVRRLKQYEKENSQKISKLNISAIADNAIDKILTDRGY